MTLFKSKYVKIFDGNITESLPRIVSWTFFLVFDASAKFYNWKLLHYESLSGFCASHYDDYDGHDHLGYMFNLGGCRQRIRLLETSVFAYKTANKKKMLRILIVPKRASVPPTYSNWRLDSKNNIHNEIWKLVDDLIRVFLFIRYSIF